MGENLAEKDELIQRMLDEISQDEKEGKTQIFIKHVPEKLLDEFREKIVTSRYHGSIHEAICSLMQQALNSRTATKDLPASEDGWYLIPKDVGDKMFDLLQITHEAMPAIEKVVAIIEQQRKPT